MTNSNRFKIFENLEISLDGWNSNQLKRRICNIKTFDLNVLSLNTTLLKELFDGSYIKLNFPVEGHLLRHVTHKKISKMDYGNVIIKIISFGND